MSLDLNDIKVRLFKKVLDVVACVIIAILALEGGLALFWPQWVRSVAIDGKVIEKTIEFEKGALPGGQYKWLLEAPEYKVEYSFNNDGFRDKAVHINPKPKGLTRFLILGDSFTFGGGNQYEDVFGVIFEQLLLKNGYKADVVKAGNFAGDTFSDVVKMESLSGEYNPDYVVLTIHANDLLSNRILSKEEIDNLRQELKLIKIPPKQEKKRHSVVLFKRILRLSDYFLVKWNLFRWWKKIYVKNGEFRKNQVQITQAILERAKIFADSQDIKLIVLFLPEISQVIGKAREFSFAGIDWDASDEELKEFAQKQGIHWITVSDAMVANYIKDKKDLFYRYDGHLTKEGNRLVGQLLFDSVNIVLGAGK